MRITVTARHCDVSSDLRERARALVHRLARVASRPHDGQVIFADDHGVATVELRLHTARGVVVVGRAEATDHRSALDRAAARVRRQLDKSPTKRSGPARRRSAARGVE
ncbi:MAG TPA: HPF/RaiA family ribosome-associated protein [Gemmatimonadales bacterium]|jgi:ribosomal subunit interface protein